jgi:Ca2+-binding EF-hand superfamily protein
MQASPNLTDAELQQLFEALDVDKTGSVDAQEFFAGVLQAALQPQQAHTVLETSFKLLDRWAAAGAAGGVWMAEWHG